MKKIFDTHSHLYHEKFKADFEDIDQRAREVLAGVFLPNISRESIGPMHDLMQRDPEFYLPMIGLHPSDVKENWEEELAFLKTYLDHHPERYYGIGETGIDLYWDKSTFPLQQAALEEQIKWAKKHKLPIILHAREAIDECTDIISAHWDQDLTGIFHCFDGNQVQANRIMELGNFKFGIGGILTYRKDVMETVTQIPLEFLVLETDSPYLPPVPHRKDKPRRNESSYTKYVSQKLADLKGVTYDEVAGVTNDNVYQLFTRLKTR